MAPKPVAGVLGSTVLYVLVAIILSLTTDFRVFNKNTNVTISYTDYDPSYSDYDYADYDYSGSS